MILLILFLLLSVSVTLVMFLFVSKLWWHLVLVFIISFIVINVISLFILMLITLLFPHYKKKNGKLEERVKPYKIYSILTYLYSDYIRLICGVRINVKNKELYPNNEPVLVILNHQSLLDPLIFFSGLKKKDVCFIMKKEIRKSPFLGRWVYHSGFYYINRQNNREGLVTILNSINAIKNGRSIGVFIEGTRSKGPNLGEFHDAALKMALKSNCKIAVCVLDNCYNIFKNFPFKKTKVLLKVCDVLDSKAYENMNTIELGNKIRKIMEDNLEKERNLNKY